MQTIRLYRYEQIVVLQLCMDNSLTMENRVVYTKPIVLYKGIDNPLKLLVKNEDQKLIDISGGTLSADLLYASDQSYVGTITATNTSTLGVAELVIPSILLTERPLGYYTILIKYTADDTATPVYGDDNYGVAIPALLKVGYQETFLEQDLDMRSVVEVVVSTIELGNVVDLVDEKIDLGNLTLAPPKSSQVSGPALTPPNLLIDKAVI